MTFRQRHLTTRHGTNSVLFTFTVCNSLSLAEDVPASTTIAPTTILRVVSTPRVIADGEVLEFKTSSTSCAITRFTTVGSTPIGSRTITITPYIGPKFSCRAIANLGPVDLTGRIYRAQVKKKLGDLTPLLTLDCTTQPLAGTVSIACDSTALPLSEDFFDPYKLPFPRTDKGLQTIDAIDPDTGKLLYPHYAKAIAASFFWDLEYTLNGNGPIPDYQGRFWMQKEATV
jgi:hypothetical protein